MSDLFETDNLRLVAYLKLRGAKVMSTRKKPGRRNLTEFELLIPDTVQTLQEIEIFEMTIGRVEQAVHHLKLEHGLYRTE